MERHLRGRRLTVQPAHRECDAEILIVGASFGGVSAALAAARAGRRVVLTEIEPGFGGRPGFPGIRPRPDVFDTVDGLAVQPYIRESVIKTVDQHAASSRDGSTAYLDGVLDLWPVRFPERGPTDRRSPAVCLHYFTDSAIFNLC